MTYGQLLLTDFSNGLSRLENLAKEPNEPEQIRDIVTVVGAKTELFLKSIVLPNKNPRKTFEWFINQLAGLGVSQQSVDHLHSLRKCYNECKHDPTKSITLIEATDLLRDSNGSINEIVNLHLGSVDSLVNPHTHRVFWIAAWDHYAHGDTEVHVILPVESDHWLGPPALDIIYINGLEWDAVKRNGLIQIAILPEL